MCKNFNPRENHRVIQTSLIRNRCTFNLLYKNYFHISSSKSEALLIKDSYLHTTFSSFHELKVLQVSISCDDVSFQLQFPLNGLNDSFEK